MDLKNKLALLGGDPMQDPKQVYNTNVTSKSFNNTAEGYALDWNPHRLGYLASGSCDNKVYIYKPHNDSFNDIVREDTPYLYHKGSVEDI